MFKYLNTPRKGSRHTDYTFVTDTQITHLLRTHRFHICHSTEVLTDTAFYSLGWDLFPRNIHVRVNNGILLMPPSLVKMYIIIIIINICYNYFFFLKASLKRKPSKKHSGGRGGFKCLCLKSISSHFKSFLKKQALRSSWVLLRKRKEVYVTACKLMEAYK